ncbi:MAG: GAF domain-containing protein [Cytophagales bacterium]|nr:GAF domain-containing protein [Cytophagales bacterium]MDW8383637.1 GAF domain-containing protein [Flammeovirgaceae bacterium]
MKRIIETGLHLARTDYEKQKVILCNYFIIAFIFICITYIVLCLIISPLLMFIPFIGLFNVGTSLLLNKYGFFKISRFIISISSTLLVVAANVVIINNELSFTGSYLLAFSFVLTPVALFDLREEPFFQILSLVICFLAILFRNELSENINLNIDGSVWNSPIMDKTSTFTAILTFCTLAYLLQKINWKYMDKNEEYIKIVNEQNASLLENQSKLNQVIAELEKEKEKEKQKQWAANALSEFNVLLQKTDLTDKENFNAILSFLVKRVGASVGALYLKADENQTEFLEMVACYAYNRRKYLHRKFDIGEGLVGQVFLEKELTILYKVPNDYMKIRSGLGDTPPSFLLLNPVEYNQECQGILEIAHLEKLDDIKIKFLQEACDSLAVAIINANRMKEIERLLMISQEQTQMLQQRDEELRQNMEELTATQDSVQHKNKQLESYYNTVNSILPAVIGRYVYDEEGSILSINEYIQRLTESSSSFYRKKDIYEFIHPEDRKLVSHTIQNKLKATGKYDVTYRIVTNKNNIKEVYEKGVLSTTEDHVKVVDFSIIDLTEIFQCKGESFSVANA